MTPIFKLVETRSVETGFLPGQGLRYENVSLIPWYTENIACKAELGSLILTPSFINKQLLSITIQCKSLYVLYKALFGIQVAFFKEIRHYFSTFLALCENF